MHQTCSKSTMTTQVIQNYIEHLFRKNSQDTHIKISDGAVKQDLTEVFCLRIFKFSKIAILQNNSR